MALKTPLEMLAPSVLLAETPPSIKPGCGKKFRQTCCRRLNSEAQSGEVRQSYFYHCQHLLQKSPVTLAPVLSVPIPPALAVDSTAAKWRKFISLAICIRLHLLHGRWCGGATYHGIRCGVLFSADCAIPTLCRCLQSLSQQIHQRLWQSHQRCLAVAAKVPMPPMSRSRPEARPVTGAIASLCSCKFLGACCGSIKGAC